MIDKRSSAAAETFNIFSCGDREKNSGRTTVVIYINIISINSIHELNIVKQSNASFWMPKRQQKMKMSLTALISWSFELQSEQMSFESFGDWNLFRAGNSINFEFQVVYAVLGLWNRSELSNEVVRGVYFREEWRSHRKFEEYYNERNQNFWK